MSTSRPPSPSASIARSCALRVDAKVATSCARIYASMNRPNSGSSTCCSSRSSPRSKRSRTTSGCDQSLSVGEPHRGPHLRGLHGILPARYATCAAQGVGTGTYVPGRARQDGRSANARRPFPHDRRPYLDLEPLHRTPKRTEDALAAIEPRVASAAAAQDHRGRRYRRLRQIRHVVETFWVQGAILRAFPGLQAPSRESWVSIAETQALLKPDDALLLFLDVPQLGK